MSKRRRTLLIGLVAVPLVGVLVALVGERLVQSAWYRCPVPARAPATWAEIQDIARIAGAQAGPGYHVRQVYAAPVDVMTSTGGPPATLRVRIDFVASEPSVSMGTEAEYRVRAITFEDHDRCVQWQHGHEVSTAQPALDAQERFDRVRLGPHEVYRLAWEHARQELSDSIPLVPVMASLHVADRLKQRTDPESIWLVGYRAQGRLLRYRVDAQTGQIVSHHIDEDQRVGG